jgi:2'-5' RNA ligase
MSTRPWFCSIVALPRPAPPPCRGAGHGRVGAEGDDEFGDLVHRASGMAAIGAAARGRARSGQLETTTPPTLRPVVQSVELLLAPETERTVVGVWQALLGAGLPSQARHTAPSNRPHVTLVAVPRLTTEAESAVAAAVRGRLPVDATWGEVTFFGRGPWVLVRLVEPGDGMRALQAAVAAATDVPRDSTSWPERWRPHVTLARRVGPAERDRVAELASHVARSELPTGMRVVARAVRRWDGSRRVEWLLDDSQRG